MARKTFISYKYSEAQDLRDRIVDSLGDDAIYYRGETTESPDLTDTTAENIKNNLKDMMFDTSVTIVIVSPNMVQSKWIDWEIEYSLKEITRDERTSATNGVVGVIMKSGGGYDWLTASQTNADGCSVRTIDGNKLYPIINNNRYNIKGDDGFACAHCKTYDRLTGSYISLVDEELFLKDPGFYIESAYDKSKKLDEYNISKQR
ncbi:TIR domain-containing protein [Cupriavidus pauculus]|uniref:TIR domain-containing protein n=1 Tax=Cupriavidus pauculus TaxID=82633 RepID=UPI003857F207